MKTVKHLQINVAAPCSQSWQEMTPANGGRNCAACAKTVTDFTGMTDRELFEFFRNGNATCGRFYPAQLQRIITAPPAPSKTNWISGFALIASLLFSANNKASAQQKKLTPLSTSRQHVYYSPSTAIIDDDRYGCVIRIRGRVYDESGMPVEGARVSLAKRATTLTDAAGHYLLEIPGDSMKAWSRLTYSYRDYDDVSYQLFPEEAMEENLVVDIQMKKPKQPIIYERLVLGGAFAYRYADDWWNEYYEPCVASENRFEDWRRTGTGMTTITPPSFKFIGRFFSQIFKGKKHADKNS